MNFSNEIKQAVSMQDICAAYGFEQNRTGFICCPFHNEKTPSMKIYENGKGYYCFGCGAGGDVINFVMRLFGDNFNEAMIRINNDFNLGLPFDRKISLREKYELKDRFEKQKQKQLEEKLKKENLISEYIALYDKWISLDKAIRNLKPCNQDALLVRRFIEALQKIEDVRFQLEEKETEVILCA